MCRTVVAVEARRVGSHGWGVMASIGTVKLVGEWRCVVLVLARISGDSSGMQNNGFG